MSLVQSTPAGNPIIGCTSYRRTISERPLRRVYGLTGTYVEAIIAAGGIPLLIPIGLSEPDMQAVFERIDGLLLPGGGDVDPSAYTDDAPHATLGGVDAGRDKLEFFMARAAITQRKPLLAICRGLQVLNVALGGTLWQDVAGQMPGATIEHKHDSRHPRNHLPHTVAVQPGSRLADILTQPNPPVNSLHHQGIRDLAADLTVSACSPDGLIEGVEVAGHPFAISVQWHPEDLIYDDPAMLALFQGLVEAATHYATERRTPVGQGILKREGTH